MKRLESALVAPVPEAEACVAAHHERYDEAARHGIPAHVTLLCPFVTPSEIDDALTAALRALFASHARFQVVFRETRRFPGTLYLAPEPAAPFRELTEQLVAAYPDHPPYGGAFDEIVPHLTVAHDVEPHVLEAVNSEVTPHLPFVADIATVLLMVGETEHGLCAGPWREVARFGLPDVVRR